MPQAYVPRSAVPVFSFLPGSGGNSDAVLLNHCVLPIFRVAPKDAHAVTAAGVMMHGNFFFLTSNNDDKMRFSIQKTDRTPVMAAWFGESLTLQLIFMGAIRTTAVKLEEDSAKVVKGQRLLEKDFGAGVARR